MLSKQQFCAVVIHADGTLLPCCQGLVVGYDRLHRLLDPPYSSPPRDHSLISTRLTIAKTCLDCQNSQRESSLDHSYSQFPTRILSRSPTSPSHLQQARFLGYSSLYWRIYANGTFQIALALRLFHVSSNCISSRILWKAQKPYVYPIHCDKPSLFNGLLCT